MPFWYQPTRWWVWGLYPFSLLLRCINHLRYLGYQRGWISSYRSPLPVIVVGNISVGGNGKTPFVISLCELLIANGYRPGVISRGYGGKAACYPLSVDADTSGKVAGDEPVLIHQRLQIPVVVDPVRANAAAHLAANTSVDVIVTDDGLQHYALQRDIEIVIVDGQRRYGNQHIMPMGPLREPVSRLKSVDYVINNGVQHAGEHTMILAPTAPKRVDGQAGRLDEKVVNACAAIGYPPRFFATLTNLNYQLKKQVHFADHHPYQLSDFTQFESDVPLLMTEKDAVKCTTFAQENWWYLPIDGQLSETFTQNFLHKLQQLKDERC